MEHCLFRNQAGNTPNSLYFETEKPIKTFLRKPFLTAKFCCIIRDLITFLK